MAFCGLTERMYQNRVTSRRARGLGDQGFERLVRAFQDHAAGERDGLDVGLLGPVAVDGERFHDAVLDPGGLAGRQPARAATAATAAAAAGPGRSRVARVERVGAKRDAVGEELFTQASAAAGLRQEAAALVGDAGVQREEQEHQQIGDRLGLEDDGVCARGQLARLCRRSGPFSPHARRARTASRSASRGEPSRA